MMNYSKWTFCFVKKYLQLQIVHFCLNLDSTEDRSSLSIKSISCFAGPCTQGALIECLTDELKILKEYATL